MQRMHLLSAHLLPERKESSLGHRISDKSGLIVKKALRKHFCCSKWCFLFLFPRNANSCLTKKLSLLFGADASALKLILCSPCTGKETGKILPAINLSSKDGLKQNTENPSHCLIFSLPFSQCPFPSWIWEGTTAGAWCLDYQGPPDGFKI